MLKLVYKTVTLLYYNRYKYKGEFYEEICKE